MGAILKEDHHLVQTILNALVSRSLSEYVQLPLLEDEVEEALMRKIDKNLDFKATTLAS